MNISLGGPDKKSLKFLEGFGNGFFVDEMIDNCNPKVQTFLKENYFLTRRSKQMKIMRN
jgi:hypothetical protein